MPTVLFFFFALVALCSAIHAEPSELTAPTDIGESTPPTIRRASSADTTNAPSATITLSDGSVVKGLLCDETLPAVSDNLGDIRIDLGIVRTIEFDKAGLDGPNGQAGSKCRISFRNGDLLTVRIPEQIKTLQIDTLVGTLSIPLGSVASVMIASHSTGSLIYHCTFDSPESITHPAIGPSGRYLGGEFVPGKVGNALRSWNNIPVAEVDLPKGMLGPRGTIEFWAQIEGVNTWTPYGDGGNPQFFGLWLFENEMNPGACSTYLQFTSNDGGGMSGLSAMVYHRSLASDPSMRTNTYGPVLDNPASWHHYALVWDKDGIPGTVSRHGDLSLVAVYLDGKLLKTHNRHGLADAANYLNIANRQGKLAFPVPAARWNGSSRHIPFLIDEFKIWSEPKVPVVP